MINYQLFTILLIFQSAGVKSFEVIEFCQEMAIKDCTSNLVEVFQALEERNQSQQKFEKCAELQVSSHPSRRALKRRKKDTREAQFKGTMSLGFCSFLS